MKIASLAALILAAVFLAACNGGQITPDQQALIQSDLDTFCPVLAALQPATVQAFNGNVAKAYNTLSLACPPNPPPTNWVVIGADMLDAVTVIQPYINAYLKTHPIKLK